MKPEDLFIRNRRCPECGATDGHFINCRKMAAEVAEREHKKEEEKVDVRRPKP